MTANVCVNVAESFLGGSPIPAWELCSARGWRLLRQMVAAIELGGQMTTFDNTIAGTDGVPSLNFSQPDISRFLPTRRYLL